MTLQNLRFTRLIVNGLLLISIGIGSAAAQETSRNPSTRTPEATANVAAGTHDQDEYRRRLYTSVGIGFDFSRGDYGEPQQTNSGSIPLSLKLEYEPVTFKLSVPYVVIDGADGFVAGESDLVSGGGSSLRHGIGDTTVSLMYSWYPERKYTPIVDLTTKVKIPTASPGNIGTGKADVTLQFELTETIGPVSFFSGAGYRFKGGSLDDIWLTTLGASLKLARGVSVGTAYDFRQSSTATAGDSHEIAFFTSIRLGPQRRIGPYGVLGLSENSPDWGLGATFSYEF